MKYAMPAGLPCTLAVGATLALLSAVASAAGFRMYVASTGADGNPCTTAAPCRTLQYAVTQVDADGEVVAVDSAGYGPVTIGKSVSIIAPRGIYAGISVPSGVGVDIAAPGAKVTLEGLTISNVGSGSAGVRFSAGAELVLVNCSVSGMNAAGLDATAAGARVYVHDAAFTGNLLGVSLSGVVAVLDRVRISGPYQGLLVDGGAKVAMRGGLVSGHPMWGIAVSNSTGTKTTLAADSTVIVQNGTGVSISANGAGSAVAAGLIRSTIAKSTGNGVTAMATLPATAVVTLTANDISDNFAGVQAQGSGVALLATGNTIARNAGGGLVQSDGATLQTLVNNTIDSSRAPPTGGALTTVGGY